MPSMEDAPATLQLGSLGLRAAGCTEETTNCPGCCQQAAPEQVLAAPWPPGQREGGEGWGRICPGSPQGLLGGSSFQGA